MEIKQPEEDTYDLASDPPRPVISVIPPADPQPISRAAIAYRSKKVQVAGKADPETIKNLHMPMWLLGCGVAIEIIAAFLKGGGANGAIVEVGVELILGTAVMLAGILLAARIRQIELGQFWTSVFKLSAIAVAPAAVADLAYPLLSVIPFGGLLGLLAEFILYFALLGALFDLDESDTWYCVWVIFLVRLVVYFAILGIRAKWG